MLGAIVGDVVGSVYEWNNIKTTEFPLFKSISKFTDDTVLTIAVADTLLHDLDYAETFKEYTRKYPGRGYGGNFSRWVKTDSNEPYNSWGNGSAMRVSPVGWVFNSLQIVLDQAKKSADVTHNHPEGIKGAQAVASAIFFARSGEEKKIIKAFIMDEFGYNLDRSLAAIRPSYKFDVSCQGTVPEAIIAFLESENFEDAIRKAISLGGDSDTLACITGSIAEAFYKEIPEEIEKETLSRLD
ncbi:ADP-ribosylglycohydrolase family protein, partial [Candidatus Dependentiae bacterium]|nr:ADP-ribosylglycohydrolase family protein [Candidatus Dependentiae bacterium]